MNGEESPVLARVGGADLHADACGSGGLAESGGHRRPSPQPWRVSESALAGRQHVPSPVISATVLGKSVSDSEMSL